MTKALRIIINIILILLGISLVAIASIALFIKLSPKPAVWMLRNRFGEEPEIKNVENYDEIKNNVIINKNLVYPSQDGRNSYDIYLPKNIEGKLPTIFWVHGGAFVAGTKDGIENYAVMLANEGYAVVGVDYQWAPEIKYPGQARQIEECLAELKNVDEKYRLDLSNIVLFGDSAGAHIAAQALLLASNPEYQSAIGLESTIKLEQIRGAVLYCGPYDVSRMLNTGNKLLDFFSSRIGWALLGEKDWQSGTMIKTTTIKDYTTSKFPSTFISDGNSGSFESQGRELANSLRSKGVDVYTLFFEKSEYGNVGHEYQFSIADNGAGSLCYERTIEFLDKIIK